MPWNELMLLYFYYSQHLGKTSAQVLIKADFLSGDLFQVQENWCQKIKGKKAL